MYNTLTELAEARAQAWQALLEQRAKMLRPKEASVTEMDRKVLMDALCAEKEKDYLFLDSLWDLVKMGGTDGLVQSHEDKGSASPLADN